MELYEFFRGAFAWMASIACLWPINIPMLALAQRIREGPLEEERRMEGEELWPRSAFGSLGLAATAVAFLFLDWFLAVWSGVPSGMVHLMTLIAFVSAGTWVLSFFFAFEEMLEGLGLFSLYLLLPIFVLWPLNYFVGFWNPLLRLANAWLKQST